MKYGIINTHNQTLPTLLPRGGQQVRDRNRGESSHPIKDASKRPYIGVFNGMFSRPVTTLLVSAILIQGTLAAYAAADSTIGLVRSLTGNWSMVTSAGKAPVKRLDAIPEGAKLISENPKDEIVIEMVDKSSLKRIGNEKQEAPVSLKNKNGISDIWKKTLAHIEEQPDKYVFALTKGADDLQDGVVRREGIVISLKDIVVGSPSNVYELVFRKVGPSGPQEPHLGPFVLEAVNRESPLTVEGIGPGIWQVKLVDKEHASANCTCWMLVCDGQDFLDAHKEFSDVLKRTKEWQDSDFKRGVLHASIKAIAEAKRIQ